MKKRLLSVLLACLLLACLPLTAAAEDAKPESIFAKAKDINENDQVYDGVAYKDSLADYANEYKLVLTQTADITVKYTSSVGQYLGMVLYREDGTMVDYALLNGSGLDYDTEGTPIYWEKYVLPQGTYSLVFAADGKNPAFSFLVQGMGVKHNHDYQPRNVVPSTCTTQGYTEYACYCGLTQNRDITAPLGHNNVSGTCTQCGTLPSGVRYQLDGLGCLTFTGDGAIGGYGQGEAPWYASREKIASVVFPAGIAELGSNLFYGCDNLKTILFQGDAPKLAEDAFTGVSGTVHYRDTANGWDAVVPQGFGGLLGWDPNHTYETVEVPATCTEEGYTKNTCACGAEEQTDKTAPKHDAVEHICIECAQWGKCGETTTWSFDRPTGVLTVSGTGLIQHSYYWGNLDDRITTAIIEDGVTNVVGFAGCDKLTSVKLPDSVTTIDSYAFNKCPALSSVTLPESVTSIEEYAFGSCDSLKQFTMPGTLSSAEKAFDGCADLHVTILPGSTAIGEKALYKCIALKSVSIPDTVESIGKEAFYGCDNLYNILFPDSVTSIEKSALCSCDKLVSVSLPDSVTNIADSVFASCYALPMVTIPASVTSIGRNAFYNCSELDAVYFEGEPEIVGELCFQSTTTTVYYPTGTWQEKQLHYGGNLTWEAYNPCEKHGFVWTETKAPDCLAYGLDTGTCAACGQLRNRAVDPVGHIWDEGVITIEPTEEKDGEKIVTCTVCGIKETQVVMNLNHTHAFGEWTQAKAPTCTEAGLERRTCRCGEEETREAAATGHTEVTDPAEETSCTAPGKTEGTHCSACGQVLTPQTEIPMLPHTEVVSPAVEPTCMTPGKAEGIVCSVCDTVIQEAAVIPSDPSRHVMVDGVCRVCGMVSGGTVTATGTWCVNTTWTLLADGTFVITGSGQMESDDRITNRETPWDAYKDRIKTVIVCEGLTNIASSAFALCENLTKAYIADSVERIDEAAFYGCAALEAIEIPKGVTTIGPDAYYGCNSVTEITVPETVVTIEDYAFCYCGNLETITIPGTLKTVPYGLTIGCAKLTTVNLAEGIENLTGGAFANCPALETITIPASVKTVGDYSFSDSGLKEITFLGDAPAFGEGNTVFENVTANAYYPVDNATWTDSVKQNYGGTINWGRPCAGHVWDWGTVTADPTEETEGVRTFLCFRCGAEKTETIAKLEPGHVHEATEYVGSDTQHWLECACGTRLEIADHDISDEWVTDEFDRITHYHRCAVCGYETDREAHTDADSDSLCDVCGDAVYDGPGGYEDGLSWSVKDGVLAVFGYGKPYERSDASEYPWYPYRDTIQGLLCLNPVIGAKSFQGYPQLDTALIFFACGVESQAFADCGKTMEILFYGPAPRFAEDSFLNTTASVKYDEIWDASVQQNYGGTLTWSHQHSHEADETPPTCTGKGFTTYTCVCGDTYTDNEVDPLGHSLDDGVVTREPTLETDGEKTFTCTVCGETTTEVIPKLEEEHTHSYEGWEHDEAGHWQACACGETTSKEAHTADIPVCGQTLPCEVCGADTTWDRSHEDANADGVCDICGWEVEMIAAGSYEGYTWGYLELEGFKCLAVINHDEMPDLDSPEAYPWYRYHEEIQLATVLGGNVGSHAFQGYPNLIYVGFGTNTDTKMPLTAIGPEAFADNSGLRFLQFEGPAPEIAEDAFKNVTATAEYDGTWDESLLQDYGGDLDWTAPENDHTHSYTETVTAPTCTEKGFTTYICDCGETYTGNETDPLGHSWNDGKVTKEPTLDAEGEKLFLCTVCGETKTQTIPKLEEPGAIKPHSARARLTGDEALAYDALVPFLREIAAGTRTPTEVKIGEGDGIDAEVKFTVKKDDFDYSAVIKALQIDFPYELYWNNYYANSVVQTHTSQRLVSITFRWQVDEAYRGSSEFTTDPEKLAPAHTALANAKAIAAKYDGKSDYEKLYGYCEEILKWTDSAENLGIPEEDIRPWQMISVFDGDPATGVICEGYSKAFQYLCNLGGLVCYPVEGTFAHGTSAGDHQWNVVTLDGENYLVDVTWSEGSLHKEDSTLFLAGGSGSVTGGYIFRDPNGGTYTYNNRQDNIKLWGEDVLTLSNHYYTCTRKYTSAVTAPTCTEQGYTTYTCDCGHSYQDDFVNTLDHSWNDGKVTKEPTLDAEGEKLFLCTVCGETKTQTIPKLEEPGAIKPHSARARLTGDEALAYDALVPFLREIAAGTRTPTEVKIGEGDGIDAEVKFTVKKDDFDYSAVIKALQIDFPYELYWNNFYANSVVQTHTSQRMVSITFRWQVDEAYRGSSEFATDPDKLVPAHTALANANAIAAKYDGKSDYEKLHGYWQEIMDLTEYATGRDIPEKDIRPWQMVSVFDGDPNTKVICEGYSKAFQYLCNLGGLVCYPVEGKLPGGDHQWNIVTLDGKNYLVDVTNSEPGLSGQDGTLFLAGASGSVTDGYTHVNSYGQASLYTYREDNIPLWGEAVLTLSNHAYTCTQEYTSAETAPTCTEQGYTTYTCPCGYSYQDDFVDPLGHSWKNGSCEVCGTPEPKPEDVFRIAGDNRFDTAFKVADQMKKQLGVDKFDAIIVASGTNFADALSGSYLAAVKNAPILLSFNDKYNEMTKDYIRENLKPDGTVYILGGIAAVPTSMEKGLDGFRVQRLDGKDRFETNLTILLEAGVGDKPILVCTGLSFADSLSASASELPILLVWKDLTDMQKAFLKGLKGNNIYVIGGESAVSKSMEKQVSAYGAVKRIGGGNRFETSVAIAEEFFQKPDEAVLAYAWNYPDGLCGGALAATMDAPLILTMTNYESAAKTYIQGKTIAKGIILGGETLISEEAINKIFGN